MSSVVKRLSITAVALAAFATLGLVGAAQTNGSPERFTAMAVNMDRGGTSNIEIVVNRWSTESERTRLMNVLLEKGANKLLDALQDAPKVGYIRNVQSVGWDLHYAHKVPMPEGGERIVIATDRPIGFREARNQPRSIDYPFTVIELHMNREGEGEGKMSVATKIIADKENGIITLENYGTQPVLLQSVKREKISH
jgi:hypothetical protein